MNILHELLHFFHFLSHFKICGIYLQALSYSQWVQWKKVSLRKSWKSTYFYSQPPMRCVYPHEERERCDDGCLGVVHTTNACEYLAMMTNGLPQFIILYGSQSKVCRIASEEPKSRKSSAKKIFPLPNPFILFSILWAILSMFNLNFVIKTVTFCDKTKKRLRKVAMFN